MPKNSDGMSQGFAFIEFKNPQVSTQPSGRAAAEIAAGSKQQHVASGSMEHAVIRVRASSKSAGKPQQEQ